MKLLNKRICSINIISLVLVFCITPFLLNPPNIKAKVINKSVLYISSYNENLESVPEQISGIRSVLDSEDIHLDLEYMDMNRFGTEVNELLFMHSLKYKMNNLPPYDAIIVGDDAALEFAMDYQEELFSDLPIIFLGINNIDRAKSAYKNRYFTGIIEETSLGDNIAIAKKFNPKATKVVAIVDDTLPGLGNKIQFYLSKNKIKDLEYDHINASEYSFEELEDIFEKIDDNTILLYLSMYTDRHGEYIDIKDAVKILREHTKVPIYRAEVGGVGHGILGGKMVSYLESGRMAANMVVEFFKGTPIESIEMITKSPNSYVFDYNIIKKYNIDESLIPEDADILNKEKGFYEENKQLVITTLVIIGLLVIFSFVLIFDNIKRRMIEKALKESYDQLADANEQLSATEEELRAQFQTIQEHVEKIEILNHKNEFLALHDYLTNLPNRMNFNNKLHIELGSNHRGAILLIDIDDFKRINDTLGHIYGDLVLKEVADRLSFLVNKNVFLSRFGGDEFVLLISEDDKSEVIKYIEIIKYQFQKSFILKNKENHIQFSIGISRFPDDSTEANQLIMNADTAMYKAKNSGKNNFMFYHEDMQEELKDKVEIEAILRQALREDGFVLHYQPQVNVITGEIASYEALLRLKEFNISPAKFINVAEESGLIIEIGRWVTNEVVTQLAKWRDIGYPLKIVSLNFSSKQLRDIDYISYLNNLLISNEIEPKYIEIEITESCLLAESDYTFEFLEKLKDLGVKIALDDFGTGYSSINYLSYIPANKVKLDKSLSDKFLEIDNTLVIDSIISLAHGLELEITAEGIEEYYQYQRLKEAGCDYIQGYLFSKPMDVLEVERMYYTNYIESLDII